MVEAGEEGPDQAELIAPCSLVPPTFIKCAFKTYAIGGSLQRAQRASGTV